jgi:hypothetical protein
MSGLKSFIILTCFYMFFFLFFQFLIEKERMELGKELKTCIKSSFSITAWSHSFTLASTSNSIYKIKH